jgi:outer membrane murein-binding lipoprotein Lpp
MAERRLDLRKNVFNKTQYIKTINTSFDELGTTTITEELQQQPNTEEFFELYNSLFYDIPALGETNSHQYLIRTSGDYVNFDEISEEVQALQAEIAQLRQDLLRAQMASIRQAASGSESGQTNEALAVLEQELVLANQDIINTATALGDQANTSVNVEINRSGGTTTGDDVSAISSGGDSGGGSGGGSGASSGGSGY